jgi:hypothetical protein
MEFAVSPAGLRVLAGFLANIAAGLLLLLFTIRDAVVLTVAVVFAILCLGLAVKLESLSEKEK